MTYLQIKNLKKTFPGKIHALRGVDLQVEKGEGIILLGHNGSGKSTLLRCLNGLETPTSGEVYFQNQCLTSASPKVLRHARKDIGFIFQRFHLVANLTTFQNVLFGALGRVGFRNCMNAFASNDLRQEAMQALDRVGLSGKAQQRADHLSGGQQQRVAIARTLVQRPNVMLADEPIASLDPHAAREVMDLLWDVGREHKFTVICTLHQLDIALDLGERIVGLRKGEKVLDDTAKGLKPKDLDWLYDGAGHEDAPLLNATPLSKNEPNPLPCASPQI